MYNIYKYIRLIIIINGYSLEHQIDAILYDIDILKDNTRQEKMLQQFPQGLRSD